jgi:hypothetical protein
MKLDEGEAKPRWLDPVERARIVGMSLEPTPTPPSTSAARSRISMRPPLNAAPSVFASTAPYSSIP